MTIVERQELADALERIEDQFSRFQSESLAFRSEVRDDVKAIRADLRTVQTFVDRAGGALTFVRIAAGLVGFGGVLWIIQVVANAKVLP